MRRKKFWCGWQVPDSIPNEHMVEKWPDAMQGWCTGHGLGLDPRGEYRTYAGLVLAGDANEANAIVRSCYGKSADDITMRWDPIEKPDDFEPGDRFIMPKGKVLK